MYQEYISELINLLSKIKIQKNEIEFLDYEKAMSEIVPFFMQKKRLRQQLFFIGNGGSAAIASHMTADFMKNGGMKTVTLYDNALSTCMGNDYGYEFTFSKPLDLLGNKGDLLVAISSSGNSLSIVNAIKTAKQNGMDVITLSGFKENNLIRKMGNYNIYVPISHYGIVESIHNIILQQIVDTILKQDEDNL